MINLKYIDIKGKGHFCLVKRYIDEANKEFALKELRPSHYSNQEYKHRLNREIYLLKKLQGCENIIELLDAGNDTNKGTPWYLMPFANQNLYKFVRKNIQKLTIEEKFNLVEQIIKGAMINCPMYN